MSKTRDPRLDLFRGLALAFMFIDHTPANWLRGLTARAWGFSDAAEMFVLVSGMSAGLAYHRYIASSGWLAAQLRALRRCWTLYIAHLLLVLIAAALLMIVAESTESSLYLARVNLLPLFRETEAALPRLVTLGYMPHYLDILPLYIVLLVPVPLVIAGLQRWPRATLAASAAAYLAGQLCPLPLPSYPRGETWFFDPLAWQILFYLGVWLAVRPGAWPQRLVASPAAIGLAIAYLLYGVVVAAPWRAVPGLAGLELLPEALVPSVSKTSLSPWRLASILAALLLTARFVPRTLPVDRLAATRWLVVCGKNGLEVFCLATLLSFLADAFFRELGSGWYAQLAVNAGSIGSMVLLSALLSWYRAGGASAWSTGRGSRAEHPA
jgi:hypothetical protein